MKSPHGGKGKPSKASGGVRVKDGKGGKIQHRAGGRGESRGGEISSAEKKNNKKKPSADVYELDEDVMTDKKKRDEMRRFAGVDIYEYEQPEHFKDEDDEEIDEDDAFDEEDFDRYGDVGVAKKKSSRYEEAEEDEEDGSDDENALDGIFESDAEGGGEDDVEGEDFDDDSDDADAEEKEASGQRLLATVRSRKRDSDDDLARSYAPSAVESEFSATSTAKSLSLSSLLRGSTLKKSSALKSIAKELTKLEKKRAVAVPAPTIVTARATREAAYVDTSKSVSLWQPIVKQNREKEQLSFPLKEPGRHNVTAASLVEKFVPRTSLEDEIARLVKAAGADEDTLRKTEDMELRKLDVSEVKSRQAELSKMRSLLFHAEIKAKRINKIKSKKFHKVDRKYKEKRQELGDAELESLDPEAYTERVQSREKKRAEERLTLKHKNTSKWVKHMLGRAYGDDADEETREAIQEQINLGERLRQKQLHGVSSDDEDGKQQEETAADIEADDLPLAHAGEKVKGVLGMAFMQRSLNKQREEASKLLEDLKAMEQGADLSDDSEYAEEHGSVGRVKAKERAGAREGKGSERRGEGFESTSDAEVEEDAAALAVGQRRTRQASAAEDKARKRGASKASTKGTKAVLAAGASMLEQVEFSSGCVLSVAGPTSVKSVVFEGQPANRHHAAAAPKEPSNTRAAAAAKERAATTSASGDAGGKGAGKKKVAGGDAADEEEDTMLDIESASLGSGGSNGSNGAPNGSAAARREAGGAEEEEGPGEVNPWLVPAPKKIQAPQKGQKKMVGDDGKQVGAVAALRNKRGGANPASSGVTADEHLDVDSRLGGSDGSEGSGDEDDAGKHARVGMLAAPSKEQQRLMRMAFADAADGEEEFVQEKRLITEAAKPKLVQATPGWGGWAGDGVQEHEKARKRLEVSYKKSQQDKLRIKMSGDVAPEHRKDAKLANVVINERRNRKAARYLVEKAPHQFKDADQYQRSIRMPIGADWNTAITHNKAIQPKEVIKAGKMIQPIDKPSSKTSLKNMQRKIASRPQKI